MLKKSIDSGFRIFRWTQTSDKLTHENDTSIILGQGKAERSQAAQFLTRTCSCLFSSSVGAAVTSGIRCLLLADKHHIQLNGFFRLGFGGRYSHFRSDWMCIHNREARAVDGAHQGSPALFARVMIGEDEQTIVFQYSPAFGEDRAELQRESVWVRVLYFAFVARGRSVLDKTPRVECLPGEKEIRQFRVMDIVKERRVRYYQVNRLVWQAGIVRTAAGEIDTSTSENSLLPARKRLPRQRMVRQRNRSSQNPLSSPQTVQPGNPQRGASGFYTD